MCFLTRIDFAYSRNDNLSSKSNKFGCSICANTIFGAQFVNSKGRHLVSIEDATLAVYDDEIRYPNASRSSLVQLVSVNGMKKKRSNFISS